MKKLSGIFAVCCVILGSAQEASSKGPTYIQKDITLSTTWTLANSPYVIANDVTVVPGVLLTIEPGVEVRFPSLPTDVDKAGKAPNLVVRGALKAEGTVKNPISFVPTVAKQLWGAIYFYNCDSTNSVLRSCRIIGGRITCLGSSPMIASSTIIRGIRGIEVSANSLPQILSNRISGNSFGLMVSSETSSPVIRGNYITGNNYGVYLKAFNAPTITENYIYGNLKYNLVNYSAKPLDISKNNFNSTDSLQIAKGIYDGADNPAMGRLSFMPAPLAVLNLPASSTPAQAQAQPADSFVPQIAINLGLTGTQLLTSATKAIYGHTSLTGFGASLFADFRPWSWISFGVGGSATFYPITPSFTLSTFDVGGRLFPFGSSKSGEFYLLGGLGLNLSNQFLNNKIPGFYHGFAGLGYRFAMGPNNGLELGAEYNYFTDHRDPSNGITLKAGWTFLINTK